MGGRSTVRDEAIKAFIDRDHSRVVRAVTVVCGDRERAEDAVQDAIVDVWSKRRDVNDVAGWVTVAALNRVRSRWRSDASERRALERLSRQPATAASLGEDLAPVDGRVAAGLSGLSRQQREAVALHYLLDMSVSDVARHLGVSDGTVKTHLHRGRNALREALDDSPDGIDQNETVEVRRVER
jgi:RNA polymerase sigma-70 factor, ECF subfamily